MRVFEEACGEQGVVEDLLGDELGGLALGSVGFGFSEAADDGVAWIDLEDDLGDGEVTVFVHGAHHLAELRSHLTLGREHKGGAAEQTLAGAHGFDSSAERFFEPVAEAGGGFFGEGFAFGGRVVAQVDLIRVDGVKRFALKLMQRRDHVLVDGFIHVEDLEAFGFEAFHIGAGFDGGAGGSDLVVDGFLVLLHAADVVGERDDFSLFGHRGFEAQEFGNGIAMSVVSGDAFFEEARELGVVLAPFFGVILGFLIEMLEETFGNDVAEFTHEGGVLHGLAGDVEGKVLAIDHAADEAHPVGEKLGGLGVDEDFFAIEGDPMLSLAHAHELHVLIREEEQGVDDEGGVGLEVEAVGGGVPGVSGEFVEVVVLFVGDVFAGFEPEGFDGVDALAVKVDGEADEVGVAFEDFLDALGLGEFGGVFLEVEGDGTAAFLVGGGGVDGVAGGAVARPGQVLIIRPPGMGGDRNFVGDHEGAVEADSELADNFGFVSFTGVFEGGSEGFGS